MRRHTAEVRALLPGASAHQLRMPTTTLWSKAALTNGAVDDGEDRLFDTLDTVLRRLWLPSGRQVVMSDTVGFISDLPPQLFDAFKVTHI